MIITLLSGTLFIKGIFGIKGYYVLLCIIMEVTVFVILFSYWRSPS